MFTCSECGTEGACYLHNDSSYHPVCFAKKVGPYYGDYFANLYGGRRPSGYGLPAPPKVALRQVRNQHRNRPERKLVTLRRL